MIVEHSRLNREVSNASEDYERSRINTGKNACATHVAEAFLPVLILDHIK